MPLPCKRFFRRNCLLITLVLLVLGITYYSRTRRVAIPAISLPPMPEKLDKFLKDSQHQLQESIKSVIRRKYPTSLLFSEHFPDARDDGAKLCWIHESEFHTPYENEGICMVDLDSLMDKNGYLKMEMVDSLLQTGTHGVHLAVSTIGQAKVAMAALSTRPYKITSPVVITAKVLDGPNVDHCRREKLCAYSEPIIAESLISLLKADLRAQLGVSWTDYFDASTVNQGYTWPMVVAMFELTREVRQENLTLVIVARAALVRNSIIELNWLTTVTRSNLILDANVEDAKLKYLPGDIALAYDIIPKDRIYLRVPSKLRESTLGEMQRFGMPTSWKTYISDVAYLDDQWKVVHEYDKKYFLRSKYAVLIYPSLNHPSYIGTTITFTLQPRRISKIIGRVVFFEDRDSVQVNKFTSGLKIFIDTEFKEIKDRGSQVLIGSSGYFSISSYSTRRDVLMSDNKLQAVNPCYQFEIEAEPRGLDVTLTSPIDCNYPLAQKSKESVKLRLDITLSTKPFHIYLETVGKEPVLIDQFRVNQ